LKLVRWTSIHVINASKHADRAVVVVGGGSIGRRHVGNLRALGVRDIAVCDPDADRRHELESEYAVATYAMVDESFEAAKPWAVLVCTPPHLHVDLILRALRFNAHVFVEKPLSQSLDGIDGIVREAAERHLIVQVGYNWRFHDGLGKIKAMLDAGEIGRVIWARAESGQYLPDWRPQLDYRMNYTAHRSMGGGIILDGSHELDYMRWLLGEVTQVYCRAGVLSNLEVDAEDTASIILSFASGCIGEVHLDFVQRVRARNCKIVGTDGTIVWDHVEGSLKKFAANEPSWEEFELATDANAKYVAEIDDFLACAASGRPPIVDVHAGHRVLQIALGALESAATGRAIDL
jgi:predicted dehydrogenase